MLRKIGFWAATSIIIGSIIGSGVFMKPSSMASQLGSPIWLSLVWIIAGIFSLFGALIYAELGAMFPETGGIYVYFRKIFGDFIGFLYGWSAFAVINTASVAAIAFVCAQYTDHFIHLPRFDPATEHSIIWHIPFIGDLLPLENFGVKGLAAALVILFSWVNAKSVKAGSSLQLISTILKMGVIGILVFGIFFSGHGSFNNFFHADHPEQGAGLIAGMVAAMTGAFFAYDGWINISSMAGEIKDPQKNIPKSLFLGVLVCIAVYLLVNQAYLYVLPVEKIASSPLVASDAIGIAWGWTGDIVISVMIVICTLGAINGNVMAPTRITYAMGKDRIFLPWAGKENKRSYAPANALWLHAIWTILFIITGSFDMLADMFVFISWLAYMVGAIGVMILRRRMPDHPRPYRIWGYPIVPLLYIAFTAFYLIVTVRNDISNYLHHRQPVINSLLGILITALGIPIYFYYKKKYPTKPISVISSN